MTMSHPRKVEASNMLRSFAARNRASCSVTCIFQLPRKNGRRDSGPPVAVLVLKSRHSWQYTSLKKLKRSPAAGRNVSEAGRPSLLG
jgi:hypothetical protein